MIKLPLHQGRFAQTTPDYIYVNPAFVMSLRQDGLHVEIQLSTGLVFHVKGNADRIAFQLFPTFAQQEEQ